MEDLTGKQLGQYRVLGPLGEGGMAAVYRAYEPGLDREVALKVLPRHFAGDPEFSARFQREAKVIARLQHVHILPVHDFGQEDDYTFIVMPYIEAGTLADWLHGDPLPLPQILKIIAQVGDALSYAHQRGIVHRDIKPSNILIDDRGNCLLTDFGVAKMVEATVQLTQTGAIIGTPAYMSPEQIMGTPVDGRSDLYSLGIILFEMATGKQPYRAETPPAVFVKVLHDPLPMPRSLNPDLPESVERVILKALSRQPTSRFQTATDLLEALEQAIQETTRPADRLVEERPPRPTLAEEPSAARAMPAVPPAPAPASVRPAPPQSQADAAKGGSSLPGLGWAVAGLGGLGVIAAIAVLGFFLIRFLAGRGNIPATPATEPAATQEPSPQVAVEPSIAASSPTPPVLSSPSLEPRPVLGSTQVSPTDGMFLIYVPAGDFRMGAAASDPDASDSEKPQHGVHLDGYWIDRTEVTNRIYRLCVNTGVCRPPEPRLTFDDPEHVDHPVAWVNWVQAQGYCGWAGRRLPTEAEWEKAARGTDARPFPWGSSGPGSQLLNFADFNLKEDWADQSVDDGYETTAPAGRYPSGTSPYGAMDMAGNVWEWVSDWFNPGYYLDSPGQNPAGPEAASGAHTVRGGSFLSNVRNVRTTYRYGYSPDTTAADLGFRCAMSEATAP